MPEHYRALDWLTRRRDGESPALIAWRAGVTAATVRRATDPFGPFSRPSRQLGRQQLPDDELTERTQRWVARRSAGERVADIARSEGISHQVVSRTTLEHGPFPPKHVDTATQTEWAQLRRSGWTLNEIAQQAGVTPHRVATATAGHGPYPSVGRRLPPGLLGISEVARRRGIARNTAIKQIAQGLIPEPDFTTQAGRRLWLSSTIAT